MKILAIDPGTTESGVLVLNYGKVEHARVHENSHLVDAVSHPGTFGEPSPEVLAIEMIASYGMPVGRETFETCLWIGRMIQACLPPVRLVYRKDVKTHLCGSMKAKDGNIRQALIDKLGPPGTKRNPGPTYGVSGHLWSALAVAVYASEVEGPIYG